MLDNDIRNQTSAIDHEESANRDYHYILENEAKTKELDDDRYDREAASDEALLLKKQEELNGIDTGIAKIEEEFKKNAELQKIIS